MASVHLLGRIRYDALNGHLLSASVVTSVGTSLRQLVRSFFTSVRFLQQAHAFYTVGASVGKFLRLCGRALVTLLALKMMYNC